jgi:hypothetical protein
MELEKAINNEIILIEILLNKNKNYFSWKKKNSII